MTKQSHTRLYWKDALRQVRVELDEDVSVAQKHKWSGAYRQAQADMEDPSSVVWLPDEIADVIRQTRDPQETALPQAKRFPLTALLVALFLLIPAVASYVLAYRRIAPHTR